MRSDLQVGGGGDEDMLHPILPPLPGHHAHHTLSLRSVSELRVMSSSFCSLSDSFSLALACPSAWEARCLQIKARVGTTTAEVVK